VSLHLTLTTIIIKKCKMRHNHRIIPGHMGGQYVEGNVISVEVTSCDKQTANHIMWHYANWKLWGKKEDQIAWKGLAGLWGKEEIIEECMRLGGTEQGKLNVEMGRGIFSEEYLASEVRKNTNKKVGQKTGPVVGAQNALLKRGVCGQSLKKMQENGRKGGAIVGKQHAERKTGVCGQSLEKMRENARKAYTQQWESTKDGFRSTAPGVVSHNKKHGWDPGDRIRVG